MVIRFSVGNFLVCVLQSKEEGKNRESIKSSTATDLRHQMGK